MFNDISELGEKKDIFCIIRAIVLLPEDERVKSSINPRASSKETAIAWSSNY